MLGHLYGYFCIVGYTLKECLPKLLAFINKHHQGDKYLFWLDLASSHYAKKAMEWLDEHKVPFVHRAANPPNVPQARSIEDFWSILADKLYNGGWEASNSQQLINRIKRKVKQVELKVVETMMNDVRSKLRKIEDCGPFKILYICDFVPLTSMYFSERNQKVKVYIGEKRNALILSRKFRSRCC